VRGDRCGTLLANGPELVERQLVARPRVLVFVEAMLSEEPTTSVTRSARAESFFLRLASTARARRSPRPAL
jgi:hypothetical protein